jgi:DNA-binding MarR family transcriptional regulator
MNDNVNPIIAALDQARRTSKRHYLNTGQALTLTIIHTLMATYNVTSVSISQVRALSPLSQSSVDSHIRDMHKRGILHREGACVYAPLASLAVAAVSS